ncbi:MAG: hypothetical protein ACHQF4_07535, partial [Sphingobacteriales bacterium]
CEEICILIIYLNLIDIPAAYYLSRRFFYRIIKSVSPLGDSGNKVYLQQINIYADYKTVCGR